MDCTLEDLRDLQLLGRISQIMNELLAPHEASSAERALAYEFAHLRLVVASVADRVPDSDNDMEYKTKFTVYE